MKVYLFEKDYESSVMNKSNTVPILIYVTEGEYCLIKSQKCKELVIPNPEVVVNYDDGIYIE